MEDETEQLLRDLYVVTNNFSIQGEGVSGSLEEGYLVDPPFYHPGPTDQPEGPEGPESPEGPEQ